MHPLRGTALKALAISLSLVAACSKGTSVSTPDGENPTPTPTPAPVVVTVDSSNLPAAYVREQLHVELKASGGQAPYAWSAPEAPALPAGLTVTSDGYLDGTPTAAGTFGFPVKATDRTGVTGDGVLQIAIVEPPSIASVTAPDAYVGVAYRFDLKSKGGQPPLKWSLLGAPPAGLSLEADHVQGTAQTAGHADLAVQLTDANGRSAVTTFSLQIRETPKAVQADLADAYLGEPYEFALSAAGGNAPLTWSIVMGALPSGLALNADGKIKGVPVSPATAGAFPFTAEVKDANGQVARLSLTLALYDFPIIQTSSLPDAYTTEAYSVTVNTAGGKPPLRLTANMPPWMSLNAGTLSGTAPVISALTDVQATVTDANGRKSQRTLPLSVISAPLVVTNALPDAVQSVDYTFSLRADGGRTPYTWSVKAGMLPAGLSLSPAGELSGKPTASGATTGLVFEVKDANGKAASKGLDVNVLPPGLAVQTVSLSDATVGEAYSATLKAGGIINGSVTWSSSNLPSWLTLDPATGALSGTPTAAAEESFDVKATDSAGSATRTLALSVLAKVSVATKSPLRDAYVNKPYSVTLQGAGGRAPYTWTSTTPPAGLTLGTDGKLSGTLTAAAGTLSFKATVKDANGKTADATLEIEVLDPVVISTSQIADANVGVFYDSTLAAAGGRPPYRWALAAGSTLPAGLRLTSTGDIQGTPTTETTSPAALSVVVADANGEEAVRNLSLSVTNAPPDVPKVDTTTLPDAYRNEAYAATILASGGRGKLAFALAPQTTLPSGLGLDASGRLSGTPQASGRFVVSIVVTDDFGKKTRADLNLDIFEPLQIPTQALADGYAGASYSAPLSATGGEAPYDWTLGAGSTLPAGLTLSSAGLLAGSPTTAAAPQVFTAQVKDANGRVASQNFSVQILDALKVTTAALADGFSSAGYAMTLDAAGGRTPYTWSSITLPPGLTVSAAGALTGTAPAGGTYPVKLQVKDVNGAAAQASFTLLVKQGVAFDAATAPADAYTGKSYTHSFSASGGKSPYTFSLPFGSDVPPGLSLSAGGQITGSPTVEGSYPFTVQVTDSAGGTAKVSTKIDVYGAPAFASAAVADAYLGKSYSATLSATGGKAPVSYGLAQGSTAPAGLAVTRAGAVTGTPTAAGTFTFTVEAVDANNVKGSRSVTLVVRDAIALGTTVADGYAGVAYSGRVTATGGKAPLTFSATTLPAGLALAADGALTGTVSTAGDYTLAVQATDANGEKAPGSVALTVHAGVAIDGSTSPADGYVGASYAFTFSAGGGKAPYTFAVQAGSDVPPGLALAASGALTGTPVTAGANRFTVTVTDGVGGTATRTVDLAVYAAPAIATAGLADAYSGTAYAATLTATGGKAPLKFALAQGSALPAGLALTAAGALTGTPSASGDATFTVEVSDANGQKGTKGFTLAVWGALAAATTLDDAYAGVPYAATLTATGGKAPYSWTGTSVPPGLTLDAAGKLAGTVSTAGSYTLKADLKDANGVVAPTALPLTVRAGVAMDTQASPADGYVGTAYSFTFSATGGKAPYSFAVQAGSTLPAGLSLAASGALSGTPVAAGASRFTVVVSDALGGTDARTVDLALYAAPTIATSSLADAYSGQSYTATLSASGGKAPLKFALASGSALPSGLALTAAGGITGTPSTAGSTNFTAEVTDANGVKGSKSFTLAVLSPVAVTSTLDDAYAGVPYAFTLAASGGKAPYTWNGVALPPGLTLDTAGKLTGTVASAGSYSVKVQAADANGEVAPATLPLNVRFGVSFDTTNTPPAGYAGRAYNFTFTAQNGKAPYSFTVQAGTALPNGLTLAATGAVSGTPAAAGSTAFTVVVTDSLGGTAKFATGIDVYAQPAITTASLADAYAGTAYSATLTASGGKAPLTFTVASGSALPQGLSLSAGGVLSGTPASAGTVSFTLDVTDSAGVKGSKTLTLAVLQALSLPTSFPDGYANVAYSANWTAAGGKAPYVFSPTQIPTGLSLSSSGALSGTVASAASYVVKGDVTDANGQKISGTASLVINPGVALDTSSNPPNGYTGTAYALTFTASGGKAPYTFSLDPGSAFPQGLTLSAAGAVSGTPTTVGSFAFTLKVQDSVGGVARWSTSIDVYAPPTISTASLPDGYVGTAYSQTVTATGGKSPLTFALASGSTVPPGLSFSPGGVLGGNPGAAGTYNFTVEVTDGNGKKATKALTLSTYNALAITTTQVTDAYIGLVYSGTNLTGTGGKQPYTWRVASGSLPSTISVNSTSQTITSSGSSVPNQSTGTYTFTLELKDANGIAVASTLGLVLYAQPSITTSTLADTYVTESYAYTLPVTGGKAPITWSVTSGTLPTWMTLSTAGVASGNPDTAGATTFTVQASDANKVTTSRSVTITVYTLPTVSTASLPVATEGSPYANSMAVAGGRGGFVWTLSGALPSGLSMPSTGNLNGTPFGPGAYPLTFTVTDFNGRKASANLTLNVLAGPFNVSRSAQYSSYASMDLDNRAATPVIYSTWLEQSQFAGYRIMFSKSTDDGASFTTPVDLGGNYYWTQFGSAGDYSRPHLRVRQSDGRLTMVEPYFYGCQSQGRIWDSADGGTTWNSRLYSGLPYANYGQNLTWNPQQTQLNVFGSTNGSTCTGTSSSTTALVFRKTTDLTTWSTPVTVVSGTNVISRGWPGVAQSDTGTIYVVWLDAINSSRADVFFMRSTDGGATFVAPSAGSNITSSVNVTGQSPDQPVLRASGTTAQVFYKVGSDWYLSQSTDSGATFAAPKKLSSQLGPGTASLSTTSLFYVYSNYNDVVCAVSADAGDTWSAQLNLTNTPNTSSYLANLNTPPYDERRNLASYAFKGPALYQMWWEYVGSQSEVYFRKYPNGCQ